MKIFRIKKEKGNLVITFLGKTYYIKKFFNVHEGKSYALDSGERQIANTIEGIRIDHINRYDYAIDKINKYVENEKDKGLKGADIFCGNGYGSYLISKKITNLKSLLSIDGSKDAIKLAKKYYKTNKINFQQKFFPFKLKENEYDFIISLESIEHVQNDFKFIYNFRDSLKSGGILVLSTPNTVEYPREVVYDEFHFRHYYFENVVRMLETNGFKLLEYAGQDTYVQDEYKRNIKLKQDDEMNLIPNYKGQFLLYVFKKIEN